MSLKTNCECSQEKIISRIEEKIDILDVKINRFIERTSILETKMGFIATVVLVCLPIISSITIFMLRRGTV